MAGAGLSDRYNTFHLGQSVARAGRKRGALYDQRAVFSGRPQKRRYTGRLKGPPLQEKKFIDISIAENALSNQLEITNLTVIPQGDDESSRTGRRARIRKVQFKVHLKQDSNGTPNSNSSTNKFMLIQDTQTNGAQFVALDLLTSDGIFGWNNLANSKRFKTLWQSTSSISGSMYGIVGAPDNGQVEQWITCNKALDVVIEYDASVTTGAIGSVRSNNLYFVAMSSANADCLYRLEARIRFTDN